MGRQEEGAAAFDARLEATPVADLRLDIAKAVESLPLHYREVVVLRDLKELTIDEIALRTGASREKREGDTPPRANSFARISVALAAVL
jgi:DNA-directed RNA polymerase specialized sigma24 family protein